MVLFTQLKALLRKNLILKKRRWYVSGCTRYVHVFSFYSDELLT
jgi:hypothetical protein